MNLKLTIACVIVGLIGTVMATATVYCIACALMFLLSAPLAFITGLLLAIAVLGVCWSFWWAVGFISEWNHSEPGEARKGEK